MKAFCPNCEALIRSQKEVPVGARVRCPGCDSPLTVSRHAGQTILVDARAARKPQVAEVVEPLDDDEPRPKRRRKPKKEKKAKSKASLPLIIGIVVGVIVLAVGTTLAISFAMDEPRSEPPKYVRGANDAPTPPDQFNFEGSARPQPVIWEISLPLRVPPGVIAVQGISRQGPDGGSGPGADFPLLLVPDVAKADDGGATFLPPSVSLPAPERPAAEPLGLEELRKAVVYLKVRTGALGGVGTGFVVAHGDGAGLIATNYHVVYPLQDRQASPAKKVAERFRGEPVIDVVFDSGQPTEWKVNGEIVAADPVADLAVLKVITDKELPKPIDPLILPEVSETDDVRICGFPFGDRLSASSHNPAISINKGSVSSLRRDDDGELATVQIDGSLNPGNSGGPVVNEDGHLVGVAVATITGAGIGMAIPTGKLVNVMRGLVLPPVLVVTGVSGGEAEVEVVVPYADPFGPRREVSIYHGRGESSAGAGYDRPIVAAAVKLKDEGWAATGRLKLPLAERTPHLIQFGIKDGDGANFFSRVLAYKLNPNGTPAVLASVDDGDDILLEALDANPAGYVSSTVRVTVAISGHIQRRDGGYGLIVKGEFGEPENLVVTADRKLAVQWHSLGLGGQFYFAAVTCRVNDLAEPGGGPKHELRVEKVELISAERKMAQALPVDRTGNALIDFLQKPPGSNGSGGRELNAVTMLMSAETEAGSGGTAFVKLLHSSGAEPLDARFRMPGDMARQLDAHNLGGGFFRVRVNLAAREAPEEGLPTILDVSRLELQHPSGSETYFTLGE